MITGVRNASELPVITKNVKPIQLVASHFSPIAASQDIKTIFRRTVKTVCLHLYQGKDKI
jgi:hypothetical protein